MKIDLTNMPRGARYEDQYGKWLDVFKQIATAPKDEEVIVVKPPVCWIPLLKYLNCTVERFQFYFMPTDGHLERFYGDVNWSRTNRTMIEVLCGFRPELVDALWKIDNQWKISLEGHNPRIPAFFVERCNEFIVTNNGSFFRQEVLDYIWWNLPYYVPSKSKVCLIPCSADKPPPSVMQASVLAMLPDDYYCMIGTGVLGLVPQALWDIMPHYDSGIPNQWRLMTTVRDYFRKHQHDRVVVYHDFYSQAIQYGLQLSGMDMSKVTFVNEVKEYADYIDLLDTNRLESLRQALG